MTKKKRFKILFSFLGFLLFAGGAVAFCLYIRKPEEQRTDYERISSMELDAAFLSMFPSDSYREDDFAIYRGQTLFKASWCIPDYSGMRDYMKRLAKSGNVIPAIYLGICPDRITPDELRTLTEPYPSVTFEVIFAYPSAEYWQTLSAEEYDRQLKAYRDFLMAAPDITNLNFHFFSSQEWLIANPANYTDQWQLNGDLSCMVMLNCDIEKTSYLVTADTAAIFGEELEQLTGKIRNLELSRPDLSDYHIVFFGDSVIGNYTDSLSIPGVVAGLTGAEVYNCGYGGNSAAMGESTPISLPGIADAFFRKDLSVIPRDFQVYQGIAAYLESPPEEDKALCFVINYGLNDYFSALPVTSDDPYDITSYCGAIRTAVKTIRENAPQARIILCTPTFSASFEDGTKIMGENGSPLQSYADALLALAAELDTDVLDNYYGLGINHENQQQYLEDQIHPNAHCRYLIGCRIIDLLR